ncbi:hypothetical protein BDL97_03G084600 [Sphagnum fallax]|nr:hypothetical protein BDL97_03G084600 [Sphagnum fallax]
MESLYQVIVYVKSHMTKAYFKRFQIKFMCGEAIMCAIKMHTSGKTDYWARICLTTQDKNKCNTPKYRYVVRFTNKDIVAQITYVTLAGDIVLTAAYAHELPHYGLKGGLTNYAAAYCTGLLLAQHHLKKFELDEDSTQAMKRFATGEDFNVEEGEGKRPFRALLDVGLVRTTTGNRVFGPLKGSLDGGLDIPHSEKWFAGEFFTNYLLLHHKKLLKEEENAKYQAHFSGLLTEGLEADDLAEMYTGVHAAISADPTTQLTEKKAPTEKKIWKMEKLSYEE